MGHVSPELMKRLVLDADKSDHTVKSTFLAHMKARPDLFSFDKHDMTMSQKRALIMEQILYLKEAKVLCVEDVFENPMKYFAGAEVVNLFSPALAIKSGVHYTLFGGAVASLGTKKHRLYVDLANELKILGCFALTEMGHGSNARGVETTATFDRETDEFVIHSPNIMSQKYFIGGSVGGSHCVVFAQMLIDGEDYGVQAFVVPLRDENGKIFPSIRIKDCGHKMGLQGVDNGRMMFEHHRVPRDNLLDRFGSVTRNGKYETEIKSNTARFATMIGTLIYGRVGLTFSSIAVSKLALVIAIRYSAERTQFGPPGKPEIPILDFLTHQRRLFIPLAKTYAYHFAMRRLLQQVQQNDQKKLHILAAGMKAMATWHANDALSTARQCTGGQGYLSENRLGEMKADVEIFTTFEGDNVVLLQQVAASLLKEFRENFADLSSAFNFIANSVTTSITEKNPARKRYTTKDHLLSTSFHVDALRFRKKRSVQILASQLRSASKTKPFFEAWNSCLDLALQAAVAHIDYVVFKAFDQNLHESLKVIKGQPGAEDTKQLFKRVKNLFALSTIQTHAAFFLEEHYVAPSKAKAISRQVNELCAVLLPHAVSLVDAFDIPDFFLPPLAKGTWVEHNRM